MKLTKQMLVEALCYGAPCYMEATEGGINFNGRTYYAAVTARKAGDRLILCGANVSVWRVEP